MKQWMTYIVLISMVLFGIACSNNTVESNSSPSPRESISNIEENVIQASEDFGWDLFKTVNTDSLLDSNIFISPLSVSLALGMTYNGSRNETAEAMKATLHLDGLSTEDINKAYRSLIDLLTGMDNSVKFNIANSIWYRNGFKVYDDFITINRKFFDAEVRELVFNDEAVSIINLWVDEKTQHKIPKIIEPPIGHDVVMFLINAIYYKADWKYQFEADKTREEPFYLDGSTDTTCQMMTFEGASEFNFYYDDNISAVELPYGEGNFNMLAILPHDNNSVNNIVSSIDNTYWKDILNSMGKTEMYLFLPKFKMSLGYQLKNILSAMGMSIAFVPKQADFSGIADPIIEGPLWIDKVIHKTFIDVNEEGTEAAAVTAVVVVRTTSVGGDQPLVLRFNRPFIFVIYEKHTGSIMFMGKIMKPVIE